MTETLHEKLAKQPAIQVGDRVFVYNPPEGKHTNWLNSYYVS